MVLPVLDYKNLEKNLRENDKNFSLNLDWSMRERERERERERVAFEKFEIVKNM